jgi:hypothetical protein
MMRSPYACWFAFSILANPLDHAELIPPFGLKRRFRTMILATNCGRKYS